MWDEAEVVSALAGKVYCGLRMIDNLRYSDCSASLGLGTGCIK